MKIQHGSFAKVAWIALHPAWSSANCSECPSPCCLRDRSLSSWLAAVSHSIQVEVNQEEQLVSQTYVWSWRSLHLGLHWTSISRVLELYNYGAEEHSWDLSMVSEILSWLQDPRWARLFCPLLCVPFPENPKAIIWQFRALLTPSVWLGFLVVRLLHGHESLCLVQTKV